jgi:DNA uptake protein ComE-like DNA-binding protein
MNRNDRRVAIAAIIIGLCALVGLFVSDRYSADVVTFAAGDSAAVDSSGRMDDGWKVGYAVADVRAVERFPFDPNTADSSEFLRLGLRPWQVRNIYKYRAKGGIYRRKQDFARLYGLTVREYRELEPYIRISDEFQPAATLLDDNMSATNSLHDSLMARSREASHSVRFRSDSLRRPVKIQEGQHVELGTADTTQLQTVPGIGPYYAREIVRYGQRLGGYVSVDQLDEIESFPQEAKRFFVVQEANPRKLNLNRLSLNELRRHPYINYYMAKTIIDYRRLHGRIASLEDLRLSRDFPPEVIRRLKPYVAF